MFSKVDFRIRYLAILFLIIVGYFFIFFYTDDSGDGVSLCIFKNVTGYPCPACGSSRATIHLLHGHFWQSLIINPLALFTNIFIFISIVWMLLDIFKNRETFLPSLKTKINSCVLSIFFILIILNWIWNIQKGL